MKSITSLSWLAALLLFLGVACGDDGRPATDGGTDGGADAALDSGAPDTSNEPSELFGPCVRDEQCPGEDAFCRTALEGGIPGGQCTVGCADSSGNPDRTACYTEADMLNHVCASSATEGPACQERCLNGADCTRDGWTCAGVGDFGAGDRGICVPICTTDDECGAGAICNVYSGRCVAEGTTFGAGNGDPCANDEACGSGFCVEEQGGANPNGWNGGLCVGSCILPVGYNGNSFYIEGEPLPQATCPAGDVCFPNGTLDRGDMGICLDGCAVDTDCRVADGFYCRKSFAGGDRLYDFPGGVCWRIDCVNGGTCPAGLSCTTLQDSRGQRFGICQR